MTWHAFGDLLTAFPVVAQEPKQATPVLEDPEDGAHAAHMSRVSVDKLKAALPGIIGRTIAHVVIASRAGGSSQMFLVFDDGTHYEFYDIDTLNGARCVDPGDLDQVGRIAASGKGLCAIVSRVERGAGRS